MIRTIERQINKIKKISKGTRLYKDMIKRKGRFAIFKGNNHPKVLFIGEAGGKDEDKKGIPFIGKAGKILDLWIKETKIEDYAVINSVPIMPETKGKIRKPTEKEIYHFRMLTLELIKILKPKYIILLGRSAESSNVSFINPIYLFLQLLISKV